MVKKIVKPTKPTKAVKSTKTVAKVVKKPVKKVKEVIKLKPIKETMSKTELQNYLSEQTEVDTKSVKLILASLEDTILRSMSPGGAGEFTLPGIAKFLTKKVAARKAGVLVRNPATGEMMKGKAKPASVRVKIRSLSKVKKAAIGG